MKKGKVALGLVLVMTIVLVSFSGCASLFSTPREYAAVTIENQTGVNVWYLYISERTDRNWGRDWLGDNVIMNGDSYTTRLLTGQYDVKLVDRNQASYSFWITVSTGENRFVVRPEDRDR